MKVQAKSKYIRISPRKVRLVVDLVRGKKAEEALSILKFTKKAAASEVAKTIKSAIANAEHNFNLRKKDLIISEIKADEGPMLKRFQPRAKGVAYEIKKRTSHISVSLETQEAPKASSDLAKAKITRKKEKNGSES
jgi:large subunit ribosomal protein L22